MKRISGIHLVLVWLAAFPVLPAQAAKQAPQTGAAAPGAVFMSHGQVAVLLAQQLSGKKMKPHRAVAYLSNLTPPVSPWDGWKSLDQICLIADLAKCLCEAARLEVKGDRSNPGSYITALQASGIVLDPGSLSGDLLIRQTKPLDRDTRQRETTSDPLGRDLATVGPNEESEEVRSFAVVGGAGGVTIGVLQQAFQGLLLPGFDGTIAITAIMPSDVP